MDYVFSLLSCALDAFVRFLSFLPCTLSPVLYYLSLKICNVDRVIHISQLLLSNLSVLIVCVLDPAVYFIGLSCLGHGP